MKKRGKRKSMDRKKLKKKDNTNKAIFDIASRYVLLILLAIKNLWIFYFIFTPLTLYPVALLLDLFFNINIYKEAILVNGYIISMVQACIAGSAYYFLLILNLTTRGISLFKRIKIFLFSAFLFLILNIARIFLLAIIQIKEIAFFDITHRIFWYGISTVYIVVIWLLTIKVFKIKGIPFYSDFLFLKNQTKAKQEKQSKGK